ncbi:MAG: M56 family metallopeptidase [Calditrichia bacterium]
MIPFINHLSARWAEIFLSLNLQGFIFLSVISLLIFLFRKHDARFLSVLAVTGLIKLFVPPFISVGELAPVSFKYLLPFTEAAYSAPEAADSPAFSGLSLLFIAWLSITSVLIAMAVIRYIRLLLISRRASGYALPFDLPAGSNKLTVVKSRYLHSPFVIGWFRFRVVLPRIADDWSETELKTVLSHEIAHTKQFDQWINLLQLISQAIYFFNPLVWFLNGRLSYFREILCDRKTIDVLHQKPLEFSRCLVSISEDLVKPRRHLCSTLHFSESFKIIKKRITYHTQIKKEFAMKRWGILYLLTFTGIIFLFLALSCERNGSEAGQTMNPDMGNKSAAITGGDGAVPFSELTEKPTVLKRVEPVYPENSRKAGEEGMAVIKILVNEQGNVEKTEVVKALTPDLTNAAEEAAKQFKFTPAQLDGKPVKVWMTVPFLFKLKDDGAGK